jgi:hypothetical protein
MAISKRHHYIPQFLIKQFTDNDGMMYLYDKQEKRFAKERRSSKSVFFQMNRNAVNIQGVSYDNMEQLYAQLDSKFALALKDILENHNMSPENVTSMLILASSLKWRLPINDKEFDKATTTNPYADLPFEIKVKNEDGTDHTEALQHLINSELFRESMRVVFPFLPFYLNKDISEEKTTNAYLSSYVNHNERIISILGDSPLIEDKNSSLNDFGNFILPISNHDTFICSNMGDKKVTNIAFFVNKDLAVFHQSQKYIVCKDKAHLEQIIQAYDFLSAQGKLNQIMDHIFKFT